MALPRAEEALAAFRPSEPARARVAELIEREKSGSLSAEERSELDHYLQLEHLLRLAKARARRTESARLCGQPCPTGR
ncbi:MAG: hypothetical protein HYU66_19575 [Armatimonadetes bacterium]|nr:hypothetical protein [Armatimonadota bacterium]